MRAWLAPEVPILPPTSGVAAHVSVYDTAAQAVIPVGPAQGIAKLYVCGITPYDATHLGHAFTYLTFDLLNRAWRDAGLGVHYAQNVTDVDDPLLERAEATGMNWVQLADEQTNLFRQDMTALRVLPPNHYVAATEAINEVVALIQRLSASGLIYQVADDHYPDWYFRTDQAPDFGNESHLNRAQMLTEFTEHGGDPERPGKKDALDALVWRMARPGEPSWPSALGQGRPGWHIECTAIALAYLDGGLSVQGGGADLGFPHHEMCAAQARVATGQPFAQAYVHVGMVGLDGEKMSKSKGNLELVSRLRAQHGDPMAIRLALLDHHYRTDWEWTPDQLIQANRRLGAWRSAVKAPQGPSAEPLLQSVRTAMRTDLNAPQALRSVDRWSAAALAGAGSDSAAPSQVANVVDALLGVRL